MRCVPLGTKAGSANQEGESRTECVTGPGLALGVLGHWQLEEQRREVGRRKETDLVRKKAPGRGKPEMETHSHLSLSLQFYSIVARTLPTRPVPITCDAQHSVGDCRQACCCSRFLGSHLADGHFVPQE